MKISPRQAEVAALVAEGKTYQEIGRLLGIAHGTVRQHVLILAKILPYQHMKPRDRILRYVVCSRVDSTQ